jgi:hypothetical protein
MALKLTDTQSTILAAAGARDSRLVQPLPKSLRVNRGTQTIVLRGLLSKGLIDERAAQSDEEVWETSEDGSRTTLVITDAGLMAVGIEPASGAATDAAKPTKARGSDRAWPASSGGNPKGAAKDADTSREPGKDTKLGMLIAALRRKKGATIDDLMEATGWQAHSVRGAISGALKKKLKLKVASEVVEGRGRVYRIGGQAE